jgi:Mrp family chromosome partitioning ATPase
VLRSSAGEPAADGTTFYAALCALLALSWFVLRMFLNSRSPRSAMEQNFAGWTIKRRADDEPYAQPIAPSFRSPTPLSSQSTATSVDNFRLSTRVVFHVGGNPYKPDGLILTTRTLGRLRQVAEQLIANDKLRVIRVASGVGSRYAKSQIAVQLAAALAEDPEIDVVVAEGDIDAPALHKVMKLDVPLGLGFSEQLQRLLNQEGRGTISVIRIEGNLHALIESRVCSPAAFGLPLFTVALEQLRKSHRFVIVDGPVVDEWPDSTHLAQGIDAVVWVTGAGTRARDSMALASRHFDAEALLHVDATDDLEATG